MKPKTIIKIIVDVIMTVLFIVCMGYHLTENKTHEWLGTVLFVLFILHHILNFGWYKSLFKGKYTAVRVIHTIINILVTVDILLIMASGIMLSRNIFAFLNISAGMLGRRLHMISTAWGYILMAMHLGLHWGMAVAMSRKAICRILKRPPKPTLAGQIIGGVISLGISVYGIVAFIERQLPERMFLLIEYAFFDFYEKPVLFYGDYMAILVLFAAIAYYGIKLTRFISNKTKKTVKVENNSKEV